MERINTVNSGQNRVVLTPVKESFAKRSFDKLPNFAKVGLAVAIGATALCFAGVKEFDILLKRRRVNEVKGQ